ncbi:MAG: hypothetical protein U0744_17865 [Gemmataceae bacterium]
MIFGSSAVAAVCLPPLRRSGNWQIDPGGEKVPPAVSYDLDRDYFGWIPKFAWMGNAGAEEPMSLGVILKLASHGETAVCDRFRWVIDWHFVAVEAVVFVLIILPFVAATKRPYNLQS